MNAKKNCGKCEEVCPKHAIHNHRIDERLCDCCGQCSYYCPQDALQVYGEEISLEQLMEEVLRDQVFYEQSGGGVTFSGGEATLQAEYLLSAASLLHRNGIHTAPESNGLFSRQLCFQLSRIIDQFLIDLKHMDDSRHREVPGVSNQAVIRNLSDLSDRDLTIRLPVIPGFNDDENNLRRTARFAKELKVPRQPLAFHSMSAAQLEEKRTYAGRNGSASCDALLSPVKYILYTEAEHEIPVTFFYIRIFLHGLSGRMFQADLLHRNRPDRSGHAGRKMRLY